MQKRTGDVSHTVETWEKALGEYAVRTGEGFPDRFNVNLLLRMLPTKHEKQIRMRHVMNQQITYESLRNQVDISVQQHVQRAATSSLMVLSENEDEEPLDALKDNRQAKR